MSNPIRPMASQQRRAIGTCTLRDIGAVVAIVAVSADIISGARFYVVESAPGASWFGVWPEEVQDVALSIPLN